MSADKLSQLIKHESELYEFIVVVAALSFPLDGIQFNGCYLSTITYKSAWNMCKVQYVCILCWVSYREYVYTWSFALYTYISCTMR